MPLSKKDLSDIAKEFAVTKSDQADDKSAIPNIEEQVAKKQEQVTRTYIPYNNAHIERITPYEQEHRWLNGVTYTTITQSQIETVSQTSGKSVFFFPDSWTKSNAQLQPNGNGNPKTTSLNSEDYVINSSIYLRGLSSMINIMRNGISGAGGNTVTKQPQHDIPAGPISNLQIDVDSVLNFNANDLIFINKGSSSGLYYINSVDISHLTISSIIPSQIGFTGQGSSIRNNVAGFTLSERQSLTSSTYQELLTNLSNEIISAVLLWETALNNQLAQLNINIDSANQISVAKSNINTAKSAIDLWQALSNTGISGKFTDTNLNNLTTAYSTRTSFISTRASQITTALGNVSQDSQGNYSGAGLYLQRYKCLNFLINTSNGPLYQIFGLNTAKTTFQAKVANASDKLATYSNLVRYGAFMADPSGNSIKIDSASQFSNGDAVLLTGTDLPSIECNVSNVSGQTVTLNINIPKEYTKSAKSGIIKAI
jgi:hypothetical protein